MMPRSHPNRNLLDHLSGVKTLMLKEIESTREVMDHEKLFGVSYKALKEVVKAVAILHDLGKATPFFQMHLDGKPVDRELSQHSLTGCIAVFNHLMEVAPSGASLAAIIAANVVKYHHGRARDPAGLIGLREKSEELRKIDSVMYPLCRKRISEMLGAPISLDLEMFIAGFLKCQETSQSSDTNPGAFILHNYLLSLLTWADRVDAAFGDSPAPDRKELDENLVDSYRKAMGFDKPNTAIDEKRDCFYRRTVSDLHFDAGVVHGRTGIGKTLAILSLALKKRALTQRENGHTARILYCLPFLSIIDQTYEVITKVFEENGIFPDSDVLMQQHHLADLSYAASSDNDEVREYETYLSDILLNAWNSEIVLTTFVSFFESIFTDRRNTRFFRIPGSIVILDEVQAVPVRYWKATHSILDHLCHFGGTRVIYSSATMPQRYVSGAKTLTSGASQLNRYTVTKGCHDTVEAFAQNEARRTAKQCLSEGKSLMFIMNTITSAETLFGHIKDELSESQTLYLSSRVPPITRRTVIERLRSSEEPHVLVSTQLIEAGIDIDFDLCLRDLAPLDSIVQVAGRINRSAKRSNGIVTVLELSDERKNGQLWRCSNIYDSAAISLTKELLTSLPADENNLHHVAYEYFRLLENRAAGEESQIILRSIETLDYEKISEFSLIEGFKRVNSIPIFLELDEDAAILWRKFEEILEYSLNRDKYVDLAERKRAVRLLAPYVVSVRKPRSPSMALPPISHGFCYVSKDDLDRYYDSDTGFKSGEDDVY